MTQEMDDLENYPVKSNVVGDVKQGVSNSEVVVNKQLLEKQKSAFYSGIGGIICLLIGWFIFGLFFGFMAASLGWTALKEGNGGAKILGAGALLGGALYILLGLNLLFYY